MYFRLWNWCSYPLSWWCGGVVGLLKVIYALYDGWCFYMALHYFSGPECGAFTYVHTMHIVHAHSYVHAYMHGYVLTCTIKKYLCTHTHILTHTHTHTRMHAHTYIHARVHRHTYKHTCIHIYTFTHTCMCIPHGFYSMHTHALNIKLIKLWSSHYVTVYNSTNVYHIMFRLCVAGRVHTAPLVPLMVHH